MRYSVSSSKVFDFAKLSGSSPSGNVLLGDGKLNFKWQNYDDSGFFIREEIKHLAEVKDKNGKRFIITAINESKPKIFALDE